jgi:diguanylate cyclase (GGDEF)-like protein
MVKIINYFSQLKKSTLLGFGIVSLTTIGYVSFLAGVEISTSIFYLLPIAIVSWCAGRIEGGLIALASSISWYVADSFTGRIYSHPLISYWNLTVMFGFFFVVSYTLSGLKNALEMEKARARVDSLTGLANARYFSELASREIERCQRYKHPLTLLYIDCDGFKSVNDLLGHQTGDQLLRFLAAAMRNNTRTTDIVARLGGDEFAILMPETGQQIVPEALKRLHGLLTHALLEDGWPVSVSMGAAIYLQPPPSADEMIKNADRLMFLAKNRGKNTFEYKVFKDSEEELVPPPSQDTIPSPALGSHSQPQESQPLLQSLSSDP